MIVRLKADSQKTRSLSLTFRQIVRSSDRSQNARILTLNLTKTGSTSFTFDRVSTKKSGDDGAGSSDAVLLSYRASGVARLASMSFRYNGNVYEKLPEELVDSSGIYEVSKNTSGCC